MNNAWMGRSVEIFAGPMRMRQRCRRPRRSGAIARTDRALPPLPGAVLGAPANFTQSQESTAPWPTKATSSPTSISAAQAQRRGHPPAAGIISQYVKDLSVENPNAPESFQWQDAPQIDVQFNIGARQISDEVHEVELKIVDHRQDRQRHRLSSSIWPIAA